MIWSDSQVAANAGIAISQACLVDSIAIQPWAPLPIEEELARVQRYYCKSFKVDTLPASAIVPGRILGSVSAAGATAGQLLSARYPVTMRSAASGGAFNHFNPGGAGAQVRNLITGDDAAGTGDLNQTENGFEIQFTGQAAWVVGQPVAIQFTADAEL